MSITIYRKPIYTDQYLQWDSHHSLTAKYSVVNTLTHKAKVVCTGPELLTKELQHLRRALTRCKYPKWALEKVERKILNNSWKDINTQGEPSQEDANNPGDNTTMRDPNKDKHSKGHIVIPQTQGLGRVLRPYAASMVSRLILRGTGPLSKF